MRVYDSGYEHVRRAYGFRLGDDPEASALVGDPAESL